jgi:hypothetical protein
VNHIIATWPDPFYITPGDVFFFRIFQRLYIGGTVEGCFIMNISSNSNAGQRSASLCAKGLRHVQVNGNTSFNFHRPALAWVLWQRSGTSNAHCGGHESRYAIDKIDCSTRTVEYLATVGCVLGHNIVSRRLIRATTMLTSSSACARCVLADCAVVIVRFRYDIPT